MQRIALSDLLELANDREPSAVTELVAFVRNLAAERPDVIDLDNAEVELDTEAHA